MGHGGRQCSCHPLRVEEHSLCSSFSWSGTDVPMFFCSCRQRRTQWTGGGRPTGSAVGRADALRVWPRGSLAPRSAPLPPCRPVVPVSELQRRILREIAANRSPDSCLAGATVRHQADDSPRFSQDLDPMPAVNRYPGYPVVHPPRGLVVGCRLSQGCVVQVCPGVPVIQEAVDGAYRAYYRALSVQLRPAATC